MNEITRIEPRNEPMPLPTTSITIRPGTLGDVDFLDALQRKTTKQVGFMPRKQFEGKVAAGHVLIAEEVERSEFGVERHASFSLSTANSQLSTPRPVGYLIGNDQYFKHDDVGIIYQMNVVPERRRSLVAATLLQTQFARSAYGCKLYCCWCAQDLEANRFWESMGFVPLAYRAGSEKKSRVHIFWQKRIRQGDASTPWWFPSLTTGGSIPGGSARAADPAGHALERGEGVDPAGRGEAPALPAPKRVRAKKVEVIAPPTPAPRSVPTMGAGRLSFFEAPAPVVVAPVPVEKPKREKRAKQKHDPKLVAAARELRDRYLEQCDARPTIAPIAKYEVGD